MEDFYPNKNHGPDSGIGSDNGEKRLSTTEVSIFYWWPVLKLYEHIKIDIWPCVYSLIKKICLLFHFRLLMKNMAWIILKEINEH